MIGGFAGREQWGVVWKETKENELIPVRVKIGITDFTYTELKEGDIKEGDILVISQINAKSSQQRVPGQQGPMGGPGGMPRRM